LVRPIETAEVRRLLEADAQVVEVLPEDAFRQEHLPGAVNIPMAELTEERALSVLDPALPIITYCYDHECDLSARAAARLEAFGCREVYDYTASKVAWLGMGLPYEGSIAPEVRAGHLARPAATCPPETKVQDLPEPGPGAVVLVIDDEHRVLGSIRPDQLEGDGVALDVAHPAPSSVRPSIQVDELGRSMQKGGESHVIVSRLDGVLIGIVERGDLSVDR
jgi:rhodanese-related sulfurtransferase